MSVPTSAVTAAPLAAPVRLEIAGTLTGANVELFGENLSRRMLVVQNLSATESIWIRCGSPATAAAPSLELRAGGTWAPGTAGWLPTESVNVIGTGVPFAAWEA